MLGDEDEAGGVGGGGKREKFFKQVPSETFLQSL